MLKINPDDGQERGAKEKITTGGYRETKTVDYGRRQQGHAQFYYWIAQGDPLVTVAASAPEDKIADEGDVLIPSQWMLTSRTVGGGKNNGALVSGQTMNDDIEKTADNSAKDQGNKKSESCRFHSVI
jgi:hypothetical protein